MDFLFDDDESIKIKDEDLDNIIKKMRDNGINVDTYSKIWNSKNMKNIKMFSNYLLGIIPFPKNRNKELYEKEVPKLIRKYYPENKSLHLSKKMIDEKFEEIDSAISQGNKELAEKYAKAKIEKEEGTKCQNCGEILNQGTFAVIREKKDSDGKVDESKIIKVDIVSSLNDKCEKIIEKEKNGYEAVKSIYDTTKKDSELKILKILTKYKDYQENGRCLVEYDRIYPIDLHKIKADVNINTILKNFDEKYENKIDDGKARNNLIEIYDKLIKKDILTQLLPGERDDDHFGEGGASDIGAWNELGQNPTRILFDYILNFLDEKFKYENFIKELKKFITNSIDHKLVDIELILGSKKDNEEYGLYIIDFDKTEVNDKKTLDYLKGQVWCPPEVLNNIKLFGGKMSVLI